MRPGLPRAADVVLAALGLLLAAPVVAIAAVAIKLDTRGPVFYRQQRVGHRGELFEMWKLRTMSDGAPLGGIWDPLTKDDPRVTRVGAFLRRTSLDELPNLINVLRGEMAIVGPRPTIPSQVELFSDRQRRRHAVRPGMTGWAQINGRVGVGWGERIELDLWYVDHRSLRLDLRILATTAWLVVSGAGLYTGE